MDSVSEMDISSLQVVTLDRGIAEGIYLRAIPYIGQYGNFFLILGQLYKFMYPLTVLKPMDKNVIKLMPPKIRENAASFAKNYPKGEIDFFVINHNGASFVPSQPGALERFNYVIHPYIFYNCRGKCEDKAFSNSFLIV